MLLWSSNHFDAAHGGVDQEIVTRIVDCPNLKIERIVSLGQQGPRGFWYDQAWAEWVMVLAGSAGLQFDGKTEVTLMSSGDCVLIPPHARHRVGWTAKDQPTIWLAEHFPGAP